jgi:hypothetical protein
MAVGYGFDLECTLRSVQTHLKNINRPSITYFLVTALPCFAFY